MQTLTDQDHVEFLYGGAAGGAKAQPLDAIVYTPFGGRRMGDMKIGDVICHPSGTNTNVIAINPQGEKLIYEVTFIDGAKTRCCKDHLWYVWYASDKSKQEKKSGLKGKVQTMGILANNLHRKPIIPLCAPINFTLPKNRYTKKGIIPPYILGALIGDGSLTKQVSFTSIDPEIVEKVRVLLPEGFTITNYEMQYNIVFNKRNEKGYGINPMRDEIVKLGLNCKSEHKFIPKEYFTAPVDIRFDLVRGLMDTDGSIDKRGHCSFGSSSLQLIKDVQYLVRSLGYKATLTEAPTKCLTAYKIYIQGANCEELFYLPRKKDRAKAFNGGFSESGRRIISIKEVGIMQAQCITVDSPDGLYITDDFIVTHNSWTGCVWLAFMCLTYPGTKWFIGRESLKRLRESTLITFFKVCSKYGIQRDQVFKYNGQDHFIEFENGSRIDMLDLRFLPSDPLYERYGSIEYTGGWIEEGGEINFGAYDTLKTRIGRHMNDFYGIVRKLFISCNPKKNWMYTTFFKPAKDGSLPSHMTYLPCLVQENPFIEKDYIKALESTTDKVKKERLLKGNWEYDDNPNALCAYDTLLAIFGNDLAQKTGKKYITADIARFGSDKARIAVWDNWTVIETLSFDISKTTEIQNAINHLRRKHVITKARTIADEDGVGGGVVDNCGIKGFSNGGKTFDGENYKNLQTQCGYKLAERINNNEVGFDADISQEEKDNLVVELEQLQTWEADSDGKLKLKPKEEIKKDIGHSPDWRDLFLMRSYFDYSDVNSIDINQIALMI